MNDTIYRVVQVHRDRYLLRNKEKELYCTLTGSMRYREEFPVVGDDVEITENPYGDSLILGIRPRRTMLCRPDRRGHADGFAKTLQVQPLAANVDYVFIITSLNQDFSINRLEKENQWSRIRKNEKMMNIAMERRKRNMALRRQGRETDR